MSHKFLSIVISLTTGLHAFAISLPVIPAPREVKVMGAEFVPKTDLLKDVEVKMLVKSPINTVPKEGYILELNNDHATITASDKPGLDYARETLRQLCESGCILPEMVINDSPRLPYRGMMIDISRHFRGKDWIKKQIDMMARLKLNTLHLHLTDAAGWRLEIKKYPRLTNYAAWRPNKLWKDWNATGWKYCEQTDTNAHGGYLTQTDCREIVNYAAEKNITVIPEIEMPSHSEEITEAYPWLGCDVEAQRHSDVCPGKESTFEFYENVLNEVMDVFPSRMIHIGGDEAVKGAWKTCPQCKARMDSLGIKDVDQLQSYLVNRIGRFLKDKGRVMVGWDEVLDGDGVDSSAVIMVWRGLNRAKAGAENGHPVVLCPGGYCYFDAYQDAPYSQPQAFGGYLPLEKVYSFDPVADSLSNLPGGVIGLQGNLFTEYVPTDEHAEYMLYPRMYALAEDAWSLPENKDWDDFHHRALNFNRQAQELGYNPFDLDTEIGNRPQAKQPLNHLAVGKKVTYNVPWWDWYPANRYETLTDGLIGGWNYNDGRWQGYIYRGDERMDVTVDLEKPESIKSIGVEFMQFCGPGVWFPEHVEFYTSDNGKDYTLLRRYDHEQVADEAVSFNEWKWEGDTKARYVRVRATSPQGCLFASEIVVL